MYFSEKFPQFVFSLNMKELKIKNLTDEQIVDKIIREGKKDLFGVLYTRYFSKVNDKCYSFFKDKQKSEEFANDILTKSFEKLESFKGKSSFSSWLYSITYNTVIDYLRKKKQLHYPNWNQENELPEILDESDSEKTEISYENLLQVFEHIHPEEKALLMMKYQDYLPIKEIAISLSTSEDAVKMRLKRARTRVVYLYFKMFGNE
jgi:RNA polymerase sigma factor (sigma-70 family)